MAPPGLPLVKGASQFSMLLAIGYRLSEIGNKAKVKVLRRWS
jgi:hypothetical protein